MIKILTHKNFLRLRIFQPNGSLLNRVLGVLVCLLALMCFGVLTCLHLRILGVFTCLRVYAWTMLACSVSLCADMIYMFVVLKYLTCLRACMLLWHRLSYFLCIWKVNFQKSSYRKNSFYSNKYLEPTWTSMKEFFVKKN